MKVLLKRIDNPYNTLLSFRVLGDRRTFESLCKEVVSYFQNILISHQANKELNNVIHDERIGFSLESNFFSVVSNVEVIRLIDNGYYIEGNVHFVKHTNDVYDFISFISSLELELYLAKYYSYQYYHWQNETNPDEYISKKRLKIRRDSAGKYVDTSGRPGEKYYFEPQHLIFFPASEIWFGKRFEEVMPWEQLIQFQGGLESRVLDNGWYYLKLYEIYDGFTEQAQLAQFALRHHLGIEEMIKKRQEEELKLQSTQSIRWKYQKDLQVYASSGMVILPEDAPWFKHWMYIKGVKQSEVLALLDGLGLPLVEVNSDKADWALDSSTCTYVSPEIKEGVVVRSTENFKIYDGTHPIINDTVARSFSGKGHEVFYFHFMIYERIGDYSYYRGGELIRKIETVDDEDREVLEEGTAPEFETTFMDQFLKNKRKQKLRDQPLECFKDDDFLFAFFKEQVLGINKLEELGPVDEGIIFRGIVMPSKPWWKFW